MSDAPEYIHLEWPKQPGPKIFTHDEAQALRADALQRAAAQGDPWIGPVTKNKTVDAQSIAAQQIKARILALADEPATAALERIRREARAEALVAARQVAGLWDKTEGPQILDIPPTDYANGWLDGISHAQKQIAALTPAAKGGEG